MSEKTPGLYHPTWKDSKTGEVRVSPTWWARISCRGTCGDAVCSGLHRVSTETESLVDAKRWRIKKLAGIQDGKVTVDVHKTTYADLESYILDDYTNNGHRSIRRLKAALAHLREAFAGYKAVNVTGDRLAAYVKERRATAAPATVRQEMAAIRRMFGLALKHGRVGAVPHVPSIRVDNTRQGFFTEAEIEAILSHLPEDLKAPIEFLSLTGWRKQEALTLKWSAIDWQSQEIRLRPERSKNATSRVLPFSEYPALRDLLYDQAKRQSGSFVFHRAGRPVRCLRVAWRRATKAAGIPGALVHDLRRSMACRLIALGVPEQTAMSILGHKTRSIFARYNVVTRADVASATARLSLLDSQTGKVEAKSSPFSPSVRS